MLSSGDALQVMAAPDWALGLPLEMLAAVAAAAGDFTEMAGMRGACKYWRKGFEVGVRKLTIGREGPLLPANGSFSERFAGLTSLDVGESPLTEADIAQLAGLKQLQTLTLGMVDKFFHNRGGNNNLLFATISGSCFQHLRGLPITDICLSRASALTRAGLEELRGLPLTRPDLTGCENMSILLGLQGLPISSLVLTCEYLEDEGLIKGLAGLPLVDLDLSKLIAMRAFSLFGGNFRQQTFTGAGLSNFSGMPLRSLNLSYHRNLVNTSLENLRGLPLSALNLEACGKISDVGSAVLSEAFGITDLNLCRCHLISDEGLGHLVGMPLSQLNLEGCNLITDEGLGFLRGMKLTSLDLEGLSLITNEGLRNLVGMPLQLLSVHNCKLVSGEGLKFFHNMPLTKLNFGGCSGLTDANLGQLQGLPLTSLDLSGYPALTDASIRLLEALPLKFLVLPECCQVSYMVDAEFKRRRVNCRRHEILEDLDM